MVVGPDVEVLVELEVDVLVDSVVEVELDVELLVVDVEVELLVDSLVDVELDVEVLVDTVLDVDELVVELDVELVVGSLVDVELEVELDVEELELDEELLVLDEVEDELEVEEDVDEDVEEDEEDDEVDDDVVVDEDVDDEDDVELVDVLVVVVAQPQVVMTSPFASTYEKPAELLAEPSFTPLSMMSLFELFPLTLYATMLVLHGHTSGPFGAVYVKVIVQFAPGQLDMAPQTVWLPKSVLLMMTSTPAPPAVQVSVPSSSVAPTIFEVTVWPGWMS